MWGKKEEEGRVRKKDNKKHRKKCDESQNIILPIKKSLAQLACTSPMLKFS